MKIPPILLLMKDWKIAVASALVIFVCFAYTNIAIRVICFLVSVFLAIMAYCYFEHAVLFRDKWKTVTSGKRRTPPGQSVIIGSVLMALAAVSMVCCFYH
jgi:hypothetical protein